jgi:hypothetical protein
MKMAVKNETAENLDAITFAVPKKEEGPKSPTVSVFLPEIPGSGGDMKVDQYEHVTIANERGEKQWHVKRGEHVDVPVEVFCVLKARYPQL